MAMKKAYYTVNGEIIGEKTAGGSRIDYLTDALGSVTATRDQTGAIVNTYRYKPYGARLAKTGTGADPSFTWVGEHGYRQTSKKYSDAYIRARHYDDAVGRWTSKDPLRDRLIRSLSLLAPLGVARFQMSAHTATDIPDQLSLIYFAYADQRPTMLIDSSGLVPEKRPMPVRGIGQIPPGETCESNTRPGGNTPGGVTACHIATGKVWTLWCDTTCGLPCTDAHEGQHRHDLGACCNSVHKCRATRGRVCDNLFRYWDWGNRFWLECRGYHDGQDCRKKMYASRHCSSRHKDIVAFPGYPGLPLPPIAGCTDQCCHDLEDGIVNDEIGIGLHCSGLVDPWGKPPVPCPFSSSGKITAMLKHI